ncbi:MAG: hypothetical protein JSS32_00905 [Verrucomicrobia bacterium]|nr:hypothetical protein [Verrucomicrobiota bacterium]
MAQAVTPRVLSWDQKSFDEYHCIFQSGKFACMFTHYFNSDREYRIVDLETNKAVKTFRCEKEESILNFEAPWVVTKNGGIIKIWNMESSSSSPEKTLETDAQGIKAGAVHGHTIVTLSTQNESMKADYVMIVRDFRDANATTIVFQDEEIDMDSGIAIYGKYCVYSTLFGGLKLISLEDPSQGDCIHWMNEEELGAYLEKLNESNLSQYEKHNYRSIRIDGDIFVGSTETHIKVWDLAKKMLMKEIPVPKEQTLLSLQGRLLVGTDHKDFRIWDIFSGTVVYHRERNYPGNIPQTALYKNTLYHVMAPPGSLGTHRVEIPDEKSEL